MSLSQATSDNPPALEADRDILSKILWNSDGLVPAIAVEASTSEVLMLAWVNSAALERVFETGRAWYWSRSRKELWCKGDTSGDRQWVHEVNLDCDGDALLYVVDQEGRGACHTGERTCFHVQVAQRAQPREAAS